MRGRTHDVLRQVAIFRLGVVLEASCAVHLECERVGADEVGLAVGWIGVKAAGFTVTVKFVSLNDPVGCKGVRT